VLARYVWRDLVRNPRRTLAALLGIALGVGLFSAVLFFVDGSSASMSQRAVGPLPIDMQRILTAPLGGRLHLTQTVVPAQPQKAGQRLAVRLELANGSTSAANEVVLRSEPPAGLIYVPGTARLDGRPLPEGRTDNPFAGGAARTGLNVGTIPPGGTVLAAYAVRTPGPVPSGDGEGFRTSFSSREVVTPVPANAPDPLGPAALARRISHVRGVESADPLSFVDLPGSSLSVGAARGSGSLRLFAFDAGYQHRYRDIDVVDGTLVTGQAMLSAEAAQELGAAVGDTLRLDIPGSTAPLRVRISAEVDLRRARALFYSRQGSNLEDFLYTPRAVVIDPRTFQADVVPALLTAASTRGSTRNEPVREVDIRVVRDRLDSDPRSALQQTRRIADAVGAIAPGQDYLIDNVSNTLRVAREDAALAKRMFVLLGAPGALLAAILAGYAGEVLASAQRREQATLRIRGADRRHLLRMHALRSLLLSAVGAVVGLVLGLLSTRAVLGADALRHAATSALLSSGVIAALGGFLAAGAALYAAGQASIRREINEERAALSSRPPWWARIRLDLVALLGVAGLVTVAVRTDAFAGVPGSVYEGRGVQVHLWLLALPLGAWLAGALGGGRLLAAALGRIPGGPAQFSHVVRDVLGRSLRRRSWVAARATVVLALVLAAATSITVFGDSYDRAKAADARFTLGSDLKVAPDPASAETLTAAFTQRIAMVDGTEAATPVVYAVENSLLRSRREEDVANVAAVDPRSFGRVTPLQDQNFIGMSAEQAMAVIAGDPTAVLVSTEMADFISVGLGDDVQVVFAHGSDLQAAAEMHVAGLFERLPGFPEGADALVNLAEQQRVVPSTVPDFFLARTDDERPSTLTAAVAELAGGLGRARRLAVETRVGTLAKDQSSLAALNLRGLLTLDSGFSLAMAVVAIGMFVFGMLLQRRREYVTMRAQGLRSGEIRALIVGETATVTAAACVVGMVVGTGMAALLVAVLRPLFVLRPALTLPGPGLLGLIILVGTATLAAAAAGSALVGYLKPTELLRDE
jgi:putative ABC transport system permease protein